MNLPKMPKWSKPWYKHQLAGLCCLAALVYVAASSTGPDAAVYWMCAGVMLASVFWAGFVYRVLSINQEMQRMLRMQKEAMNALMKSKAEEIGRSFIEQLEADHPGGIEFRQVGPRVTKH